jgi:hypothetical protein
VDEEISAEKGISSFSFGLRRFSKEKIPGIEKENFSPLRFDLGDQSRFLGDTAKRVPESPAGFDLAHHIIRVKDAELGLWR